MRTGGTQVKYFCLASPNSRSKSKHLPKTELALYPARTHCRACVREAVLCAAPDERNSAGETQSETTQYSAQRSPANNRTDPVVQWDKALLPVLLQVVGVGVHFRVVALTSYQDINCAFRRVFGEVSTAQT